MKMIEIFQGRKTRIGAFACYLAGGLKIGSIWNPMLDQIAEGLFYIGMGVIGYGIWARLVTIFYRAPEGEMHLRKPKLRAKEVQRG
jgi:hypothetical protein